MNSKDNSGNELTLIQAVDALTAIAETHWEQEEIAWASDEELDFKHPTWLLSENSDRARGIVRDIFKAVLKHLKHFYHSEYTLATDSKTLEGIKTIMVLVGDAAKKIDHFTKLFDEKHYGSATKLLEYKQLQEFYKKKISRTIDESTLGKWLLALTQRTLKEHQEKHAEGMRSLETRHIFVDLEAIKKDRDYELFFVRKEDGLRFFNPRIVRNMKLVADFGTHLGRVGDRELFYDQKLWEDRQAHGFAKAILSGIEGCLEKNYSQLVTGKENLCTSLVNMSIMGLMLAANPSRLLGSGSSKGCESYLFDFMNFLRLALQSHEYQRIVAYPYEDRAPSQEAALKILHEMLRVLYSGVDFSEEIRSYLSYIFEEAQKEISPEHYSGAIVNGALSSFLAGGYASMKKFLKHYPYESLEKVLAPIEDGNYNEFDPWMQMQLPKKTLELDLNGREVNWVISSSPTRQEFIHKAHLIEEFMSYLRRHQPEDGFALIFNYQDRTDWHEHARAQALEKLEHVPEFRSFLNVVSISKDTEFYWQEVPYSEDHQTQLFKEHLVGHVSDNHGGYYIGNHLRSLLPENYFSTLFDQIHRLFFGARNVLSKDLRLDFIEIYHLFLQLKLIEISAAKTVFAICKDGIDVSVASSGLVKAFMLLLEQEIGKSERDNLSYLLQSPALLRRHRIIDSERFERFISALRTIESAKEDLGAEKFNEEVTKITSIRKLPNT